MKISKRNLLFESWNCYNCKDTNSFLRKERRKRWKLTFSLDEFDTYEFDKISANSSPDPVLLISYIEDIQYGSNHSKYSKNSVTVSAKLNHSTYNTTVSNFTDLNSNCMNISFDKSLNKDIFVSFTSRLEDSKLVVSPYVVIPFIFFLLGVIFTILYCKLTEKLKNWFYNYVERYINKLENVIMDKFNRSDYHFIILTLKRELYFLAILRGNNHFDTLLFKHLLAKAYLHLNLFSKASLILYDVYHEYRKINRDKYYANIVEDIATVEFHQDMLEQSLDHYIEALDIYVNELSSRSSHIQNFALPSSSLKKVKILSISNKCAVEKTKAFKENFAIQTNSKNKFCSDVSDFVIDELSVSKEVAGKKFMSPYKRIISPVGNVGLLDITPTRSLINAFDQESHDEKELLELEKIFMSPLEDSESNFLNNRNSNKKQKSQNCSVSMVETYASSDIARLHYLIARVLAKQKKYISSLQYYVVSKEMFTEISSIDELQNYDLTKETIDIEIKEVKLALSNNIKSNHLSL